MRTPAVCAEQQAGRQATLPSSCALTSTPSAVASAGCWRSRRRSGRRTMPTALSRRGPVGLPRTCEQHEGRAGTGQCGTSRCLPTRHVPPQGTKQRSCARHTAQVHMAQPRHSPDSPPPAGRCAPGPAAAARRTWRAPSGTPPAPPAPTWSCGVVAACSAQQQRLNSWSGAEHRAAQRPPSPCTIKSSLLKSGSTVPPAAASATL